MPSAGPRRPMLRRPLVLSVLLAGALILTVALVLFQPWKLVVDKTVNEAAPGLSAAASAGPPTTGAPPVPVPLPLPVPVPAAVPTTDPVPTPGPVTPVVPTPAPSAVTTTAVAPAPVPTEPTVLARGDFISHEHESSGSVVILGLADGSRVLRLEDLDTSNGPVLKVWLTDAPVLPGSDGWYVFDDGLVVDLGELKGNIGSSNYPIPADADLDALTSVSIWCDRFDVSFAAAALEPAPA